MRICDKKEVGEMHTFTLYPQEGACCYPFNKRVALDEP